MRIFFKTNIVITLVLKHLSMMKYLIGTSLIRASSKFKKMDAKTFLSKSGLQSREHFNIAVIAINTFQLE